MTDDRMALKALLEKGSDTELLSKMLAFVANRLMAFDAEQLCGARAHERSDERINHRNGYKSFPKAHWLQLHSTNPLERLNKEIKRRTNVIGIFPNEAAITRLVGALMLEQNDEWAVTRRYMSLETVRDVCNDSVLDAAQIASI